MVCGDPVTLHVHLHLGEMQRDEIIVQLVIGNAKADGTFENKPALLDMRSKPADHDTDVMDFFCSYTPIANGNYSYGIRVLPVHAGLSSPLETGYIIWA